MTHGDHVPAAWKPAGFRCVGYRLEAGFWRASYGLDAGFGPETGNLAISIAW